MTATPPVVRPRTSPRCHPARSEGSQKLPAGWRIVPLGEIAEVKLGKMLDETKHVRGRKLPYLRNVSVRWGSIETDDLPEMHFRDDELDRFALKAGDVLVCEGGEPGRAAVWTGHFVFGFRSSNVFSCICWSC